MTRPKLLFYTHALLDGGAERLWACLATEFKARGYDVVFAQDFVADDNAASLDASIPMVTLGSGHIRATWRLARLLATERPDVALSAIGGCNTKLLLARALSNSGTRTIISYHGYNEWQTGWLSWMAYAGLPLMSRYAARTVAVSNGLKDALERDWHAAAARTVAIHNPVFFPAATPVPKRDELRTRDNVVLAAGRLVTEKDFATLIRAFALVKAPGARLVILGKGPQRAMLEAEIMRLGLFGRVMLAGYVNEPWPYYLAAKCFAISSLSEQFGNVVVEAMAHGLPVVATACTGPVEILANGRYGRIVPPGDERSLAQAIDAALADPGDPAAQRARADEFSIAARVPAYMRLIEDVVQSSGGAPTVLESRD
ncbi:MAG: glycosyltransferase [Hyphomicrobiaceae bacterium]|nr:glycosyltransferase [Hyphomicrobiaceae bacterium]